MTFNLERKLDQQFIEYKEKLFSFGIPDKTITYYTDYFFHRIEDLTQLYEQIEEKIDYLYYLVKELFEDERKIDEILALCDPFLIEYYSSLDGIIKNLENLSNFQGADFHQFKSDLKNYYRSVLKFIKSVYFIERICDVVQDSAIFLDESFTNKQEKMYNYVSYGINLLIAQYSKKKFKN